MSYVIDQYKKNIKLSKKDLVKKRDLAPRPKKKQPKNKLLQIPCPGKHCNKNLRLMCKHCENQPLTCSSDFHLTCKCCKKHATNLQCPCGQKIKASHVFDKEKKVRELEKQSDVSFLYAFAGIALAFAGILFLI